MSQCQSTPTATELATITTNSVSTSTSESFTTVAASVTTIETTVCSSVSSGVTAECSTTDIVSTISPEQTLTSEIPVDVTVQVVITTPTATLFSTTCSSDTSSSQPTSSDSSSSSSSALTTSALPPTTSLSVVSLSSTLPGGSVIVVSSTVTTIITPSTVVPVAHNKGSSNLGAIVGGAVGGAAALAVVLFLVWLILRKKWKSRDDDFDDLNGKLYPYPVRLTKRPAAADLTLDDPNFYDESGGNSSAFNSTSQGGASAPIGGLPAASTVRRRTATSSESFPNPYSSVPTSSDDIGQSSSPPAPLSNASAVSASVYSDERVDRRPLRIMNPQPDFFTPIGDVKDRTVFLSADRGLQVFGGQSVPSSSSTAPYNPQPNISMPVPFSEDSTGSGHASSSEGGTSNTHRRSSSSPFVHHDAGSIPAPPSSQPQQGSSSNAEDGRDGVAVEAQVDLPPPAYEA